MSYSVITVVWRDRDVIGPCLDSVERQVLDGSLEVLVVDNASSDGAVELVKNRARVIHMGANTGFATANNRGAQEATGDVLFFLNPDTQLLADDVLQRLAHALQQPGVGLAGPRLVNPDGTLQPSCGPLPTLTGAVFAATGLHRALPDRARARIAPAHWSHDHTRDTGWVMGAALAVRADLFKNLGGFWPILYGEDTELALKVHRRGLKVRYVNEARVMHVGNQALGQRYDDAARAAKVAQAEIELLKQHYRPAKRTAIRALIGAGYATRSLVAKARRRDDWARVMGAMARAYVKRT
jgi:GT2 family glycosyltransferase